MTTSTKQVCTTCKHYRKHGVSGGHGAGDPECWRYPPAFLNDAQPKRYATFVPIDPAVANKITCGEWAADA